MFTHILKLIWNRKSKNALMVLEIFLAFVILFAVLTVVIENVTNYRQPLGFETEQLWLSPLAVRDLDSLQTVQVKENLRRELSAHPKIAAVSFGDASAPMANNISSYGNDDMGFMFSSNLISVDEHFDKTADVKLNSGRWFNESDKNAKYKPVVISQMVYDEYFAGKPILDSLISFDGERRVVGIAENFRYLGQFSAEVKTSFTLLDNDNYESLHFLYIRLKEGVGAEFEEELTELITSVSKLDNVVLSNLEQTRIRDNRSTLIPMIALLSVCGFLVINVALGLFGVLWQNISKRRGEIGLRRALGADKSQIMSQFIIEIMLIAGFGMLVAALFCVQIPLMDFTEIKDIYFYQSLLLSAAIISVLVLICALYPSAQAARITPAEALHEE